MIDTTAMCKALTNAGDTVVEKQFNLLLAERLRGDISAGGIAVALTCFVYDLRTGVDGFTGQPLHATLRSMPPFGAYALLSLAKHLIAKNVPDDVRAEVESEMAKVKS
jgi:hypothetical protein